MLFPSLDIVYNIFTATNRCYFIIRINFFISIQQVKIVIIDHNGKRDYVRSPKVYDKEDNKSRLISFKTKSKFFFEQLSTIFFLI